MWIRWLAVLACGGFVMSPGATAEGQSADTAPAGGSEIRVRSFLPEKPISRARRPANVVASIENIGGVGAELRARLVLPKGVSCLGGDATVTIQLAGREEKQLVWQIEAEQATRCELGLRIEVRDKAVATASLPIEFLPPVAVRKLPYIPDPVPVRTPILIGAHHCPLWEADRPQMWTNVLKHPERTPALGFYSQENPEVSDWETKWAVEHGISFFVYCWYRTSQGGPVTMQLSSAIHEALFKSKFVDKMKFTIMWENQRRGRAGVADVQDLMENLLPFWMENYFKHPSYLKIDNKPVLFIYRPEFLVQDLGGVGKVAQALDLMRQACKKEGFDGLHLLGEYRGLVPKHFTLMQQLGLDYTFAYCWHVQNNPTPAQAIAAQMDYITKTAELSLLPQVVTVSQAWSGWRDEGSIWKIPPREYETLLGKAKDFIATLPAGQLGSRMLLLDNWNEWGEGHYIAPYREYGFGYLDAVRSVFSDAREPHVDLIPEDIGMGPYDTAYKAHQQKTAQSRPATPALALPTPQQVAWQDMEVGMFIHFAPNTWQDQEYDDLSTPLEKINPEKLDTDQWVRAAEMMGARYIVFVAKHVGGFCMWQTDTTDYGIKDTPWRGGKGDVLRDLSESCRKKGIQLGVYLSPQDRKHRAGIGGKCDDPKDQAAYNKLYREQLTEVLSRYGTMVEVWFDGSNVIDVAGILKQHAPKAMIFQGPCATIRWVGNEDGFAPYPAWNSVPLAAAKSGVATAEHGDPNGTAWLPNECDARIRREWFWNTKNAPTLKTVDQLMEMYYRSVGHGAVLLLNHTPDTTGLIPESDVRRGAEFAAEIKRRFGTSIAETRGQGETVELSLDRPTTIDHIITMEDIAQGERVRKYVIEGFDGRQWKELCQGTAIGHKKIDRIKPAEVSRVRLRATASAAPPIIRRLAVHNAAAGTPRPR